MIEEETINADVAQKIYDLRTKAGLSQRELAKRVGTTASVICRLEDADYEGHSLMMLKRIAGAVDYRVEVRLVRNQPGVRRRSRRGAVKARNETEATKGTEGTKVTKG